MKRREFLLGLGTALLLPRLVWARRAPTCIVIGAGMAGIAAARALYEAGVRAPVLEARDRVGGRIWTDSSLGFPVDMGAAWIEGIKDNPMVPLAQQYGARTKADDSDYVYFTDRGQRVAVKQAVRDLRRRLRRLRKEFQGQDISYAQALGRVLDKAPQQAADALLDDLETTWAIDASRLSFRHGQDERGYDGEERIFTTGYAGVVEGLSRGLDLRLGHPVTEVRQEDDRVRVVTSRGTFEAEQAIVTLPLGVLKAGEVRFTPPLSAPRLQAMQTLEMGVLDKVVLRFNRVFWPDLANFGYLSSPRGRLPLVVNWHHFSGHPALVALVAGSQARRLEGMADAAVVSEVLSLLRLLLGGRVPEPTGVLVTRWSQDPLARGSYSGLPVGCTGQERAVLARPEGRLFFAGEATSTEQPACVPGALLSGRRAARQLLATSSART